MPRGWDHASSDRFITGWNVPSVVDVEARDLLALNASLEAQNPFGGGNLAHHNIVASYGCALAAAAHQRDRLSILDWGSGLGHYYLLSRALFPDMALDYHARDLPQLVAAGRALLPSSVAFHDNDECLLGEYDFVLVSGSLQYATDWLEMVCQLAGAAKSYLYFALIPIVVEHASFVVVQRPYLFGYETEYLGWCLNRSELHDAVRTHGFDLLREYDLGRHPQVHRAPEQPRLRGFLYARSDASEGNDDAA